MRDTIVDIGLLVFGFFIIIEGIISIRWKRNDKSWIAQTGRAVRIMIGVTIVCLSILSITG